MSYLLDDMEKWAKESDYVKLNRYFQKHPDKALATLSEMKDAAKWAGTSTQHLSKKMLRKEKTADQEKTARSIEGWDLAEEERLGKLWNSPEYQKKQIDEIRANYRKVGQKMPGDVNRRNHRMKIGALAVGGMAVGLGTRKLNRMYAQKKKRAQAEQEKVAARQFKDFEDFKNSMPKDKKKAANLKFSPDDFEWGEYDAGLGYNFEGARKWHHDTYKADPKEKETIDNLYRSMHKDYQSFIKEQAAAKGDYEKALSRGKTMQRAGLGVSAGGAGLALLAGSGKLPKNLKVPAAAAGAVATIGGLGVRRKGRSLTKKEREKYNQLEIDYGKRHEEKINTPAFKNYWNSVHDHWGDWGQWMGPRSNKD